MSEEWYSPREILFQREDTLWVLKHIELIEQGRWPPDFKETGYTGSKRGRRFGSAYFESPVCIAAEVKRRLELTHKDGKILFWQVKALTKKEAEDGQARVLAYEDLESEAKCALNFMSVWDFRKRPNYTIWSKNWHYYDKNKGG